MTKTLQKYLASLESSVNPFYTDAVSSARPDKLNFNTSDYHTDKPEIGKFQICRKTLVTCTGKIIYYGPLLAILLRPVTKFFGGKDRLAAYHPDDILELCAQIGGLIFFYLTFTRLLYNSLCIGRLFKTDFFLNQAETLLSTYWASENIATNRHSQRWCLRKKVTLEKDRKFKKFFKKKLSLVSYLENSIDTQILKEAL
jgi:hypothetical protein